MVEVAILAVVSVFCLIVGALSGAIWGAKTAFTNREKLEEEILALQHSIRAAEAAYNTLKALGTADSEPPVSPI